MTFDRSSTLTTENFANFFAVSRLKWLLLNLIISRQFILRYTRHSLEILNGKYREQILM